MLSLQATLRPAGEAACACAVEVEGSERPHHPPGLKAGLTSRTPSREGLSCGAQEGGKQDTGGDGSRGGKVLGVCPAFQGELQPSTSGHRTALLGALGSKLPDLAPDLTLLGPGFGLGVDEPVSHFLILYTYK